MLKWINVIANKKRRVKWAMGKIMKVIKTKLMVKNYQMIKTIIKNLNFSMKKWNRVVIKISIMMRFIKLINQVLISPAVIVINILKITKI